jgi:hypothetical protein
MGADHVVSLSVGNLGADSEFPMSFHLEECHAENDSFLDSHFFGPDGSDGVDGWRP